MKSRNTPAAKGGGGIYSAEANSRVGEVYGRCIYLKLNVAGSGLNKIILCQSGHRLGPCEDRSVIQSCSIYLGQRGRGRLGKFSLFCNRKPFSFGNQL